MGAGLTTLLSQGTGTPARLKLRLGFSQQRMAPWRLGQIKMPSCCFEVLCQSPLTSLLETQALSWPHQSTLANVALWLLDLAIHHLTYMPFSKAITASNITLHLTCYWLFCFRMLHLPMSQSPHAGHISESTFIVWASPSPKWSLIGQFTEDILPADLCCAAMVKGIIWNTQKTPL